MTTLQTAGLVITAAVAAQLLRRYAPEQALLLALLAGSGATVAALLLLTPVLNRIDSLLAAGGIGTEQTAAVSRAIGTCCITQLAEGVCRDAGENTLCIAVGLMGKTALLLLILPMIEPLSALLEEVLSCVQPFG